MSLQSDLLEAFEVHSPGRIRELLAAGVSPTELIEGKRPIDSLIEMYMRSARFAECLRVMIDAGAVVGDDVLEAVLLDDDQRLREMMPGAIDRKFSLISAFTSLSGVTPLHVCAEYNSVRCMKVLIEAGADVNGRADVDGDGVGGHTPIFHAVNSNFNYCRPAMEMLVEAGADLDCRVKALRWGGTMDWETVVFDVTPISYAQCGLYKQFHRPEEYVYSNLDYLFRKKYGNAAPYRNVPNKYLQ